jgi:hypothetical protein
MVIVVAIEALDRTVETLAELTVAGWKLAAEAEVKVDFERFAVGKVLKGVKGVAG